MICVEIRMVIVRLVLWSPTCKSSYS